MVFGSGVQAAGRSQQGRDERHEVLAGKALEPASGIQVVAVAVVVVVVVVVVVAAIVVAIVIIVMAVVVEEVVVRSFSTP